jgi:AmiR/NasT family two-component response regulator
LGRTRTKVTHGTAARKRGRPELVTTSVNRSDAVGQAIEKDRPDVAIVALHEDSRHALELITEIVQEASCPVLVLADRPSREFLAEAAERGVFAHLDSTDEAELEGGIDIALRRYQQWRSLLGAFDRRARMGGTAVECAGPEIWARRPLIPRPGAICR